MPYDIRDFSYYDVGAEKWLTEAGIYDIEVGASSEDIRLCGQLFMEGVTPTEKACINVSFPSWKEAKKRKGMSIHENSTVGDLRYAKGWVGRAFSGGIRFAVIFAGLSECARRRILWSWAFCISPSEGLQNSAE